MTSPRADFSRVLAAAYLDAAGCLTSRLFRLHIAGAASNISPVCSDGQASGHKVFPECDDSELVGYERNDGYSREGRLAEIRSIRSMRQELMHKIVGLSEGRVKIEDRGATFRTRLWLRDGRRVAVVVARCSCDYKDNDRWRMKCVSGDHRLVAIVARLNRTNDGFMDCFVVPPVRTSKIVRLLKHDPRLKRTIRLDNLVDFIAAVTAVSKQPSIIWALNEKSVALATNNHLRRLAMFSKREFIRRGMNHRHSFLKE
jgi:hypothetical protein